MLRFVPPGSCGPATADGMAREVVLVIDCSTSMAAAAPHVRQAVACFVRDLPADGSVPFNILVFGSSYKRFAAKCARYTRATDRAAVQWLDEHVAADLTGDRELAKVLAAYSGLCSYGLHSYVLYSNWRRCWRPRTACLSWSVGSAR